MIKNKIIFVVVVYNDFYHVNNFCSSVAKLSHDLNLFECIVVDNSDIPNYSDELNDLVRVFHFVKLMRPMKNLGYFGGFNYFFKNYIINEGDVVLLCNNDLVFSVDFLEKFNISKYARDVFVVCPDVITLNGVHQNPHVLLPRRKWQRLKLDMYFSHYYIACLLMPLRFVFEKLFGDGKRYSSSGEGYLHMGIGACYILLPSFLAKIKFLDFPHFLYGEEAYISRQVHEEGGRLYYDPDLKVHHIESASLNKLPKRTTYEMGREGYWSYRNFY